MESNILKDYILNRIDILRSQIEIVYSDNQYDEITLEKTSILNGRFLELVDLLSFINQN